MSIRKLSSILALFLLSLKFLSGTASAASNTPPNFLANIEQIRSPTSGVTGGVIHLWTLSLGASDSFTPYTTPTLATQPVNGPAGSDNDFPNDLTFDQCGNLIIANGGSGNPDFGNIAFLPNASIVSGSNNVQILTANINDPISVVVAPDGTVGALNGGNNLTYLMTAFTLSGGVYGAAPTTRYVAKSSFPTSGVHNNIVALPGSAAHPAGSFVMSITNGTTAAGSHILIKHPDGSTAEFPQDPSNADPFIAYDPANNQIVAINQNGTTSHMTFFSVASMTKVKDIVLEPDVNGNSTVEAAGPIAVSADGHVAVIVVGGIGYPELLVYDNTASRNRIQQGLDYGASSVSGGQYNSPAPYIYGGNDVVNVANKVIWLTNTKLLVELWSQKSNVISPANGMYIYDITQTQAQGGYGLDFNGNPIPEPTPTIKQTAFQHLNNAPYGAAFQANTPGCPPTVDTPTATNVGSTTATLGGDVFSDGGAAISERGVVYSKTSVNAAPQIGGTGVTKATTSGTTGVFTVNVSGLTPGTGYTMAAYATNSVTTAYATPFLTFTTPSPPTVTTPASTAILPTSATLGGDVTSDGGFAITERGVVYSLTSTNANPQLNGTGVSKATASGTLGVFTANATGLSPAMNYSFAAYATNSAGTTYTSPASTFTTPTVPTVTTPTRTNTTSSTATLGGNVTSDGGAAVTERGVVYAATATNSNPQIGGTGVTKAATAGTLGVFTVSVSGLSGTTGYSFAAYATNGAGTAYTSPVSTFTTPPPLVFNPSVLSNATANKPTNQTITVSGGTPPYTALTVTGFNDNGTGLVQGNLAADSNAGTVTLSGTPMAAGTCMFTTNVADTAGAMLSKPYTLTVDPDPKLTATLTAAPGSVSLGGTINYTAKVANTDTVAKNGVAFNLTLDANTALVNGSLNASPYTIDIPYASATSGVSKAFTLVAIDPDAGDTLTYALTGAGPAHGTLSGFNAGTGMVNYTAMAGYTGPDSFTFKATDNHGVPSNEDGIVTLTVVSAPLNNFLVEATGGGTIGTQVAGMSFNIKITARDAANNTKTDFTGTVTLTSNGTSTGAPVTSGSFVNGVLTSQSVTITSAQSGTTITATSGAVNTASNTFTVFPNIANHLAFAQQPTAATAGVAVSPAVTVQILDQYNNVETANSTSSITVAIGANPGGGTLSGSKTVTVVNGVATYSDLSIDKTGSGYTLTASSGILTGSPSSTFNITPAPLNNFLVEASSGGNIGTQMAGASFAIMITARDQFNNTQTGFVSTVALSSTPAGISPTTSGAFTAGVLASQSVSFATGNNYTITATNTGKTGTSNSFTVNQAPLAVNDAPISTSTPSDLFHVAFNASNATANGANVLTNDTLGFPAATLTQFGPSTGAETNAGSAGTTFAGGTLTVAAAGTFTYTPPNNFTGLDSFKYTISNAGGNSVGTVQIGVGVRPAAVNDTYATALIGNVGIDTSVSTQFSVLANDTGSNLAAAFVNATNGTGTVSANGKFTFTPTAGFVSGNGTIMYSITNGFGTVNGTVTIPVGANRVWFIDNNAGTNGTGTLASPFNSLPNFVSAAVDAAGDSIFLYRQTATNYAGGITLKSTQKLIGQGATTSLASITGLTFPSDSTPPATGGTKPTIATNGITLGLNNVVNGLAVSVNTTSGLILGADIGTTGSVTNVDIAASSVVSAIQTTAGFVGTLNYTTGTVSNTGSTSTITLAGASSASMTFTNVAIGSTGSGKVFSCSGHTGGTIDFGQGTTTLGCTSSTAVNAVSIQSCTGTTFNLGAVNLQPTGAGCTGILALTNTAATTINVASGTISVPGPALDITGPVAVGLSLGTVTSTGGTTGINIGGATTGTITATGGSLSGATGAEFNVTGGTCAITYPGNITGSSGQHSVNISGKTGGTVALSGSVTENAAGTGIRLTTNTGATINFTGQITASTGANPAFTATGGGTVTATNAASTLTTTTGTALNVANTTIGASGLKFLSITANGGGNGIILDTTGGSGGLTVTGTVGSTTLDNSGGTIQNISGADGATAGHGIYLNATSSVSLNHMNIHNVQGDGIHGNAVSGLTLTYTNMTANGTSTAQLGNFHGEGDVNLVTLSGSATVDHNNFQSAYYNTFGVFNDVTPVSLNRITMTSNTFGANDTAGGNAAVVFRAVGGTMNVTFGSSVATANTITGAGSNTFIMDLHGTVSADLIMKNNAISNNHQNIVTGGGGVSLQSGGGGDQVNFTFNVDSNQFSGSHGAGFFIGTGQVTNINTFSGTFNNNTIGNPATANSGSTTGNDLFLDDEGGSMSVNITNNRLYQYNPNGTGALQLQVSNDSGHEAQATFVVTGNTISNPGTNVAAQTYNGIQLNAGTTAGDTAKTNLTLYGNAVAGSGNASQGSADIRLRQRFNATVGLFGNGTNYAGAPTDTTPIAAFAVAQNGGTGSAVAGPSGGFFGTVRFLMFAPGGVQAETSVLNVALTQAQLGTLVTAARARWEAAGLSDTQRATFGTVKFEVATLSGGRLGETAPGVIRIDGTAGGNGWYLDAAPANDVQFMQRKSATRFYTTPSGAPAGRIDLLTALMHEMGHALGLPDTYDPKDRDSIMYGWLTTGERRVPCRADLGAKENDPAPGCDALDVPKSSLGAQFQIRNSNSTEQSTAPWHPAFAWLAFGLIFALALSSKFTRRWSALMLGVLLLSSSAHAATVSEPNIGNLPPGKSTTITFSVTVANPTSPTNAPSVSQQATITATGPAATVLSDSNTGTPEADPTVTTVLHNPTVISVTPPSNGSYRATQNLDVTLNFSQAVTVTGTPSITITVGASANSAAFVSGSGSTALLFRYTVQPGDTDTDGIAIGNTIALNGGTIRDSGSMDAVLTFTPPSTPLVLVDTTPPSIATVTGPADGSYKAGANLDFVATFNETIAVTGSPRIPLTVGASPVFATLTSSTATTLTFRYTVQAGDTDTDGIASASPVALNGGTIKDTAGNDATLTFTPPTTTGVLVDTTAPAVSGNITVPANGSYKAGQTLSFTVAFTENVTVTGTDSTLAVTIGASVKQAAFASKTANSITYTYTILAGDTDTDGIAVGAITLNTTTITDAALNPANVSLTGHIPSTTGVLVDTTAPTISSVTAPANGTYRLGQNVDFTATFSENVTVNTTGGTPSISLTVGAASKSATYLSGSGSSVLIFRYIPAQPDTDTDGIVVNSPIVLNGGTIQDAATNNATLTFTPPNTAGILIDTSAPSIISISGPANGSYRATQNLDFVVTYSEAVTVAGGTPSLTLTIGAASKNAALISGSGTAVLTFRYTVVAGDTDTDGIASVSPLLLNGATIKNGSNQNALLTFTPPNTTSVLVDTTAPTVSGNITVPADGSYRAGQVLSFTVGFSENVTVTGTDSTLGLTIGSTARQAAFLSKTANSITYAYTVQAGETDTDGIAVGAITPNTTTVTDIAGNTANLTLTGHVPSTAGVLVDTTSPAITSVTAPANGIYAAGAMLDFTVTFSESVTFTGNPTIPLTVGAASKSATYVSAAPGTTATFRYTVQAGDNDSDGIAITTAAISLSGGTIKDVAGNNAVLAFTAPNTTGVIVDTTAPTITSVTPPANKTYIIGDNIDWTFNFSESVNVVTTGGTPGMTIRFGGPTVTRSANYVQGSGTNKLVFRYTVVAGDYGPDGVATISPLNLNGGTIKDAAGNDATLNFPSTTMPNMVAIDGVAPTITNISVPASKFYSTGQALSFTVMFSEAVNVVTTGGTPSLSLTVGSTARTAAYVSGSGSASLVFTHIVVDGDNDADGITLTSPVQLNGGTIKDIPGNSAVLTFTPPDTTGVKVDTGPPTIVSVSAPADGSYKAGTNLDFAVTFSEATLVTGTPSLALTIGATARNAAYFSGNNSTGYIFRYTVAPGDNDSDGIAVGAFALNGGSLQDAAGNDAVLTFTAPNTSAVLVDTVAPGISNVAVPADGSYRAGQFLDFVFTFSEPVNVTGAPTLGLTIGVNSRDAALLSGNGTNTLTFRYIVVAGENDSDGITVGSLALNGGTVRDPALNDASLAFVAPSTAAVLVDTTVPVITSVTGPPNGFYRAGQVLNFTVNFSENVIVNAPPSAISLNMTMGSVARSVAYTSGSGTSALTFSYTVVSADNDSDGIAISSPVALGGGSIKDAAGNDAALTFTPPNTSGVIVDNIAPTVVSIARKSATPTFAASVQFLVTFSENVSGVDAADFTLATTGVTNATIASVTGGPHSYTVTVNTGSGDGTIGLNLVDDDTIIDPAGNNLGGVGAGNGDFTGETYSIDKTPPQISISAPSVSATISGPVSYTITYADANLNAITLSSADVVLNKTQTATAAAIDVTGTGLTRTVTLSGISGIGTLGISINAGTASDTLGQTAAAAGPSATVDVNLAPVFLSGPTANPNPAFATMNVIFAAVVTPADAEIKWGYGDGTPTEIGGSTVHAYSAPGTYTVTVTARNINSNLTTTNTFTMVVLDVGSGANLAGTTATLFTRGFVTFGPKTDQIIVRSVLPASFDSAVNSTITMKFNGLTRTFTFAGKGHEVAGSDSATLRRVGPYVQFYANIKGALRASAAMGVSVNAAGEPLLSVFEITVNNTDYSAVQPIVYSGPRKGKFGFPAKGH